MYQKERLDKIMKLLEKDKYLTVKYIADKIHYSNATVNRDLNVLEKTGKIVRTYGGAEIVNYDIPPMPFRYEFSKTAKKRIAKKAADYVVDGDTVFIDGTTTTQYMGEYLAEKKNIKVITCNIELCLTLSNAGIKVVLLGGEIIESPMLGSALTIENARKYRADKCFFATRGVSEDGKIMQKEENISFGLLKIMQENSKKTFYLVDKRKINLDCNFVVADVSEVNCVISDFEFSERVKSRCKNTKFTTV